jgi:hypothetical protein
MSRVAEKIAALSNPAVLDTLPNDPDHIIVSSDELGSAGEVLKVNVRTNRSERLHYADEKIAGYVTDLDGNLRARTRAGRRYTGAYIAAEIMERGSSKWVETLPFLRKGARHRPGGRLRQGSQHRIRPEQRRARQGRHL